MIHIIINIRKFINMGARLASASLSLLYLCGCFTGIESTREISLTKEQKKESLPTSEEKFLADIRPQPVVHWKPGKRFYVTDDKVSLIFDRKGMYSDSSDVSLKGKTFLFLRTDTESNPDGSVTFSIVFTSDDREYVYNTSQSLDSVQSFVSTKIPLLIDMDYVELIAQRLTGRELWIKSNLWYDAEGTSVHGRKFVPVVITGVYPATVVYPMRVEFRDSDGNEASVFMNFGDRGIWNRTFASLFSLSDVKKNYQNIDPEVWALIQHGDVRKGMTKDECRLSLGSPKDINYGRDWNSARELWQYSEGVYLEFEDGVLVNFRR